MPTNSSIDEFELNVKKLGVNAAKDSADAARQSGDEAAKKFQSGISILGDISKTVGNIVSKTNTILASRELSEIKQDVYKHIHKTDLDLSDPDTFNKYSKEVNDRIDKLRGQHLTADTGLFDSAKESISAQMLDGMVKKTKQKELGASYKLLDTHNLNIKSYEELLNTGAGEDAINVLNKNYEAGGVSKLIRDNIMRAASNSAYDLGIKMEDIKSSLSRFNIDAESIHRIELIRSDVIRSESSIPITTFRNPTLRQKNIIDSVNEKGFSPDGKFNIDVAVDKAKEEITDSNTMSSDEKEGRLNSIDQYKDLAKRTISQDGIVEFMSQSGMILPSSFNADSPSDKASSRISVMNKYDKDFKGSLFSKAEKNRLKNNDVTIRDFARNVLTQLKTSDYDKYLKVKREVEASGSILSMFVESDEPNAFIEASIAQSMEDKRFDLESNFKELLDHDKSRFSLDTVVTTKGAFEYSAEEMIPYYGKMSGMNTLVEQTHSDPTLKAEIKKEMIRQHQINPQKSFYSIEDALHSAGIQPLIVFGGTNSWVRTSSSFSARLTTPDLYGALRKAGAIDNSVGKDITLFSWLMDSRGINVKTEDGYKYTFTDITGNTLKTKDDKVIALTLDEMTKGIVE